MAGVADDLWRGKATSLTMGSATLSPCGNLVKMVRWTCLRITFTLEDTAGLCDGNL